MKRKHKPAAVVSHDATTLRERAEARLQSTPPDIPCMEMPEHTRRIVHELQVHQVELEMQNEELQTAQELLETSRKRYFDLYDLAPVGYCTLSEKGTVLQANLTACGMLGIHRSELIGQQFPRFVSREDQDLFYLYRRKLRDSDQPPEQDLRLLRPDGAVFWASLNSTSAREDDGAFVTRLTISDATERKQAEQSLRLAASVFTHAREGIAIVDLNTTILQVNDAFSTITGYGADELLGTNPGFLSHDSNDKAFEEAIWDKVRSKGHWYGELWNQRKDGELYAEFLTITAVHDADGEVQNYIVLISDITVIKEQQNRLEHIAHYDALTNLPNRLLLSVRLQQAMRQARRRSEQLALVYLDLDGFKQVNDAHGHTIGDELLIAVSGRMSEVLREGDSLARIGGDEFVAVLVDLPSVSSSIPVLERLLEAVQEPLQLRNLRLQITVSLGVTFWPQAEAVDADQLIRQADQAMYQAKQAGRNRFHVFDAAQDRDIREHHEGVAQVQEALGNREFVLHYQPKVNMRTGELLGAEALIRWQHPTRGLLLPAAFLPNVENAPVVIDLGAWVLDTAMSQIESWRAQGRSVPISVNVSALHLQHPDFAANLRVLLSRHPGVDPGQLELEVLETSALEDFPRVTRTMAACRELGVGFALDDFGTGYSSLTYLKQVPARLLKIDCSFVIDMLEDPDDLAILEGVLGLATAFRRDVIAEGVETLAHGEMLLRLGCELGQGYAIARPMPAPDFEQWARTWEAPPTWKALEPVSRDRLPMLSATVEHRAWTRVVAEYLSGEGDTPTAQDAHECRFGRWLDRGGRTLLAGERADDAVDRLHRQLHDRGTEVVSLKRAGRTPEAQALAEELPQTLDRLVQQLRELY